MISSPAVFAALPALNDYAQGAIIEPYAALPMIELALPDPVYQSATRADLRDLRVFNADGAPVPHAFCPAPAASEAVVTEQLLAVFGLQDAQRARHEGARVEVQTAGGTQVNVQEQPAEGAAPARGRVHIIDARAIEDPLRAIQFDWASPDEASEAKVRIEASKDLDRWDIVVAASTLLRAAQGGQELRRERIELPTRIYRYLRVERVDGGPPLLIHGVVAERAAPVADIEPQWFTPDSLVAEKSDVLLFDTTRVAPVRFARLRLPQDNSSMNVTLQSRAGEKSPWRDRWSGETYLIVSDTRRRESLPAQFDATTDRYWRVLLPQEAQTSPPPAFELGYRPLRLRFLAQGAAPYTLAFGSRRATLATPSACNGLLGDVSASERGQMIGEGYARQFRTLGGKAAFKPLPKKTPTRMIVLWGVLTAGVGLLAAMALSLLKRART